MNTFPGIRDSKLYAYTLGGIALRALLNSIAMAWKKENFDWSKNTKKKKKEAMPAPEPATSSPTKPTARILLLLLECSQNKVPIPRVPFVSAAAEQQKRQRKTSPTTKSIH